MDDMVQVLDSFVEPGSELWLYNEVRRMPNRAPRCLYASETRSV